MNENPKNKKGFLLKQQELLKQELENAKKKRADLLQQKGNAIPQETTDGPKEIKPVEQAENKEVKLLTFEDIPTYMTGDAGDFSTFQRQMDKGAEKVSYYYCKDNRDLFDKRKENSDAEIILKEKRLSDKSISEEDKKQLFDVLCLYLRAYGKRGRSVTTIGIKIPKGIDPTPFMKKLAEEVYKANTNIDALYFKDFNLSEDGWNEFNKRQAELKSFAKNQFLKYANEQIGNKTEENTVQNSTTEIIKTTSAEDKTKEENEENEDWTEEDDKLLDNVLKQIQENAGTIKRIKEELENLKKERKNSALNH